MCFCSQVWMWVFFVKTSMVWGTWSNYEFGRKNTHVHLLESNRENPRKVARKNNDIPNSLHRTQISSTSDTPIPPTVPRRKSNKTRDKRLVRDIFVALFQVAETNDAG